MALPLSHGPASAGYSPAHQNILVVDDHPLMRQAISQAIHGGVADCAVTEAGSLQEAVEALALADPVELALLDVHLPDVHGLEALELLRTLQPQCSVVMLSADADTELMLYCIERGAAGFIPKTLPPEGFRAAIRQVADGGIFLPSQVLEEVRRGLSKTPPNCRGPIPMESRHEPSSETRPPAKDPRSMGLTDRQIDVLDLLLAGYSTKVMCRRLKLAEGTVKVHISAVFRALGVRTRTQAVVAAVKLGLKVGS